MHTKHTCESFSHEFSLWNCPDKSKMTWKNDCFSFRYLICNGFGKQAEKKAVLSYQHFQIFMLSWYKMQLWLSWVLLCKLLWLSIGDQGKGRDIPRTAEGFCTSAAPNVAKRSPLGSQFFMWAHALNPSEPSLLSLSHGSLISNVRLRCSAIFNIYKTFPYSWRVLWKVVCVGHIALNK